jgi:hypothetical protein
MKWRAYVSRWGSFCLPLRWFKPLLFLVLSVLPLWNAEAQVPETFVQTGNMTTPRQAHTATLLKDGRVLIAGGVLYLDPNSIRGTFLASAELYDPATGTFSPTGSLAIARATSAAALLPDGRVLIAGGAVYDDASGTTFLGSAELFDPISGTFTPTGNMVTAQYGSTATLLNNGKVLFTGGTRPLPIGNRGYLPVDAGAELYDPGTGSFSPIDMVVPGSPSTPIYPWGPGLAETLFTKTSSLFDGRILIAGGFAAPKLYDPTTNTVAALGLPAQPPFLFGHTASLLPTAKVLIAGGKDLAADYYAPSLKRAELYDPDSRTFQATQSLQIARSGHTATLLPGGLLLIAGGGSFDENENFVPTPTGELFNPYTETFRLAGSMASLHGTATLLGNGTVLFTGGNTTAAELYLPPLLTFNGGTVRSGDSFTATFSGINLNNETYYDLRFKAPGDSTEGVALNWQHGLSAAHNVETDIAAGEWTVTGVRVHQDIDDHTADFVSVSVDLLVTP